MRIPYIFRRFFRVTAAHPKDSPAAGVFWLILISPRWRKVLRDVWLNRTRSVLVILSLALGTFGVGAITTTRITLSQELTQAYAAIQPAHATLYTDLVDEDLLWVLKKMPGVKDVEGRRSLTVRVKQGNGDWRNLVLYVIPDFEAQKINKILPQSGDWPPPTNTLLVERASLQWMGARVGDTLIVETSAGKERPLKISGLAHDLTLLPTFFSGQIDGYITFKTLEQLAEPPGYNEIHLLVNGSSPTEAEVRQIAQQVRKKVEKSNHMVYWLRVPPPGKHPADQYLPSFSLILGSLGILALFLSVSLVSNTISALLAEQVWQVGLFKTLGARNIQIVMMYISLIVLLSVLSLALGMPAAAGGAYLLTRTLGGLINFDIGGMNFPVEILALEISIGLLLPLLAAAFPIFTGTRITVREALSTYGLGESSYGSSPLDRFFEHIRGLPRPLLLSLRNTFRRKVRLFLTLVALTLASAIFVSVFSVRASLLLTLAGASRYWQFDGWLDLAQSYRVERILKEVQQVPGLTYAECWGYATARRIRPDGSESDNIRLQAPPASTRMIQPTVLEGRWLDPADENALVITTDILPYEPDLKVGDDIELKLQGQEKSTHWRIVGLVSGFLAGSTVYTNYPYFAQVNHQVGHAGSVRVVGAAHDPASQYQLVKATKEHLETAGIKVYTWQTVAADLALIQSQFDIIVALLSMMAVLLAVVGSLGLTGTMNLNVLERTREIGVMRAIGASNGALAQLVIGEGIIISIVSWLPGVLLAIPLGKYLSNAVGTTFLHTPLLYEFSLPSALLWLVAMVGLATLASLLPARNAMRISVRQALAYE